MDTPGNLFTTTGIKDKHAQLWAEVILPLALPTTYTYCIPPHFPLNDLVGCRVEVVFGKNKKYAGIIRSLISEPPSFEAKDILNVIDNEPIVYPQQLKLWQWISEYYMCSEGEVMAAALPTNFKLSSETILLYNEEFGEDFSELDNEEYLVAEALLIKNELRLLEIQQILDVSHVYPVIKKLIEKKVCFVWEELSQRFKPRMESYVILNPEFENEDKLSELLNTWSRAPKQLALLLSYLHLFKTENEVTQASLLKKSDATTSQLKGLTEKHILLIEKRSIDRVRSMPKKVIIDFELSTAQQEALNEINIAFTKKNVCLLNGVTSSGKTQIYIRLIEKYFKEGKQVLYLLPEITLTSQIIRRLQKNFGGNIAIYHSKFNNNERVELWNKIRTGEIRIVLGARSALFLPFRDLGL